MIAVYYCRTYIIIVRLILLTLDRIHCELNTVSIIITQRFSIKMNTKRNKSGDIRSMGIIRKRARVTPEPSPVSASFDSVNQRTDVDLCLTSDCSALGSLLPLHKINVNNASASPSMLDVDLRILPVLNTRNGACKSQHCNSCGMYDCSTRNDDYTINSLLPKSQFDECMPNQSTNESTNQSVRTPTSCLCSYDNKNALKVKMYTFLSASRKLQIDCGGRHEESDSALVAHETAQCAYLNPDSGSLSNMVYQMEQTLCAKLLQISYGLAVSHVYNPTDYAAQTHVQFLRRYCTDYKDILFLGMNPGPFGMAQTGVGEAVCLSKLMQ